ncbi:MAG TPA: PIN domain-containing protein [Nitrospirae bacterium]|nr:PIN domain-containing protein [Nitrospirota bacterium]
MKSGYIDSSFLLSIIFEDNNYYESVDIWNTLDVFLGSVFLEIECRINIYKYLITQKKDKKSYRKKEEELTELLKHINRKTIDEEISLEIRNHEKLKRLKSLDSIHLATANIFNKLINGKVLVCSYDRNMITISKEMGMDII